MSSDPSTQVGSPSAPPSPQQNAAAFEFERLPFSLAPDADFLYWAETHGRAAECVERGIERSAPIILLTGEIGGGKSTLVQHLLSTSRANLTIGLLSYFDAGHADLSAWVLLAFAQSVPAAPPPIQFAALRSFLTAEHQAGRRCILIVDEAQSATDDELEGLRQLTNIDSHRRAMLQVVLVAQPGLRQRLADERHAPLVARIGADAHLSAMTRRDTEGYVRHRLACAGGRPDLFTSDALAEVHESTGGIPRVANMLCDLCLAEASRRGVVPIDAPLVRNAFAAARRGGTFAGLASRPPRSAEIHPLPIGRDPSAGGVRGTAVRAENAPGGSGTPPDGAPAAQGPRSFHVTAGTIRSVPDGTPGPGNSTIGTGRDDRRPRTTPSAANLHAPEPSPGKPPTDAATTPAGETSAAPAKPAADAPEPGADDVEQLAFSAMASLADLGTKGRGDRRKEAARKPTATSKAGESAAANEAPECAEAKPPRRLNGPRVVVAAATIGLVAIGFGYHALWSAVENLRGPAPGGASSISTARDLPSAETSDPAAEHSRVQVPAGGADLAAGRGTAVAAPRPAHAIAVLTTPALPTVASPGITADGLYTLALDLALADQKTAAIAFARAAVRGHARAAYYLAQIYETGDGVPRNLALARAWYAAADRPVPADRLVQSSDSGRDGIPAAPRLLSAARTSDGELELVWTSAVDGRGVEYLVELFEDPDGPPILAQRLQRSALRLAAPDGELFWRVVASNGTTVVASNPQRIPAGDPQPIGTPTPDTPQTGPDLRDKGRNP